MVGSALGLQQQQWHATVEQQSVTTQGQSFNSVPKQEFTFPSQTSHSHDNTTSATGSIISPPRIGQVVDDSVGGGSSFLPIPPRTRSKSDTSRELPTWDQPYMEQQQQQQHQVGGLSSAGVVDEQTVNMSDVASSAQQPQLNPGFTFGQTGSKPNNGFLSPDHNSIRRAKSEVGARPIHRQSRSEDIRGNVLPPAAQPGHQHSHSSSGPFLFPPQTGQMDFLSPNQQFYANSTGSPDGPLPSISAGRSVSPGRPLVSSPGHIRRASSGTRSERGAETWSGMVPIGQHRVSPYPSPHTSPRPRVSELPYDESMARTGGIDYSGGSLLGVDGLGLPQQQGYVSGYGNLSGTYTPSSTGASAYHTPGQSPSPGPPLTIETPVPKPTVTTGRTANASHKRRKQEASFVCPIPGCGSTFTRSFNLKGKIFSAGLRDTLLSMVYQVISAHTERKSRSCVTGRAAAKALHGNTTASDTSSCTQISDRSVAKDVGSSLLGWMP